MGLLDFLNPLDKVIGAASKTVDKLVLDKDEALRLKTNLEAIREISARQIEESYQVALGTKTHWVFDGLHKLARPMTNAYVVWVGYDLTVGWIEAGQEITEYNVMLIAALSGPAGLYTFIKGRGKP